MKRTANQISHLVHQGFVTWRGEKAGPSSDMSRSELTCGSSGRSTLTANHHVKANCCCTPRFRRCREDLDDYSDHVSAFLAAVAYVDRSLNMRFLVSILCLCLCWNVAGGDEFGERSHREKEPTGGLVQNLLTRAELGPGSSKRIRLLLDPQASAKAYYPSTNSLPFTPEGPLDPIDPAARFKRELDRVGADAAAYVAYRFNEEGFYNVKILRFETPDKAKAHWLKRCREGRGQVMGTPAGSVLFTDESQEVRPGVKSSMETIEVREGQYVVRLAPGRPNPHNAGFQLLGKQVEKIRNSSEPFGAANSSPPVNPQANRTPSAAGSAGYCFGQRDKIQGGRFRPPDARR